MSYSIAAIPGYHNQQRVILARLQKRNGLNYQRGLAFWGAFDAARAIATEYYAWQVPVREDIVFYGANFDSTDVRRASSITLDIINELIKIIGEKA